MLATNVNPIRTMLVDDSATVRTALRREFARFPDIVIVGEAADPLVAQDLIPKLRPAVLILDLKLPEMDGLSFLRLLMDRNPLPVIMFSSFTPRNSKAAVEALALGAVDTIGKPTSDRSLSDCCRDLARSIRIASLARTSWRRASLDAPTPVGAGSSGDQVVIAIGASTGGAQAIESILTVLPADSPPALVVVHMPARFTGPLAQHLDARCAVKVMEAAPGDVLAPGTVRIAPGDFHMRLEKTSRGPGVALRKGPEVHHQRPSVDVLFESVADVCGAGAVGILLTGMGNDGARGLLAMRNAGAHTIAESELSCVVFGMPRAAIELGAAREIVTLDCIPQALGVALRRQRERPLVPFAGPPPRGA